MSVASANRWPLAFLLLTLAAGAALLLLAPPASAAGSGFEVENDPTTDNPATVAGNIVRLGAGSYNAASCPACATNTLYVWFQTKAPYTTSAPTSADFGGAEWDYFIATNYGPSQWCTYYWLHSTATAVVTPGADQAFNTPCGDAALGYVKPISGSWVCNELQYRIPYTSMMTNVPGNPQPVAGTVVQFQQVPDGVEPNTALSTRTVQTGATGFADGAWAAGSYTLGSAFTIYQPAPTGITLQATGDNQVTVSWTAPLQNSAQPITSYKVYRGATYIGSTNAPFTSFVDTGAVGGPLVSGTAYNYQVSSVNCPALPGGGEGAKSTAVPITPEFRPLKATMGTVTVASSTSLNVPWTAPNPVADCPGAAPCAPAGMGASGIQGYKVYRCAGVSCVPTAPANFLYDKLASVACTGTACTIVDTGLVTNTDYCYKVAAYDNYAGAGGPNVGALTDNTACGKPVGAVNNPPTVTCSVTTPLPWTPGTLIQFAVSASDSDGPAGTLQYGWTFPSGLSSTDVPYADPASTSATPPLVKWANPSPPVYGAKIRVTEASPGTQFTEAFCGGATGITIGDAINNAPTAYPAAYYITVGANFASVNPLTGSDDGTITGFQVCGAAPSGFAFTTGGHFTYTAPASPTIVTFDFQVGDNGSPQLWSPCVPVTLNIVDNQSPNAQFTFSPGSPRVGESVTFLDGSRDPDGADSIASWTWTFGDGGASAQASPKHVFAEARSYTVCLKVTDQIGAQSLAKCRSVNVTPASAAPPPPKEEVDEGGGESEADQPTGTPLTVTVAGKDVAAGTAVTLTATSDGSAATTYTWKQVEGPSVDVDADGKKASFTAPSQGVLFFEVTARDGDRAGIGRAIVSVAAGSAQGPTAVADGPNDAAASSTVSLDASGSSDAMGRELSFAWVQVSGPSAQIVDAGTAKPTAILSGSGGAAVFAVAVSNGEATSVAKHTVLVEAADGSGTSDNGIGAGSTGAGFVVDQTGATVNVEPSVAADSYTWNFGDGTPTMTTNGGAKHTYTEVGTFEITMTAQSAGELEPYTESAKVTEVRSRPSGDGSGTDGVQWLPLAAVGAGIVALVAVATVLARRGRRPPVETP